LFATFTLGLRTRMRNLIWSNAVRIKASLNHSCDSHDVLKDFLKHKSVW